MYSDAVRINGLRFDVVSQILTAIFRGQLNEGDRLTVKRLAEDFKVSTTPAREALLELASYGVVGMLPNKGAVVRSFGPQQVREIYGVRSLLEVEAVRLACGKLPAEKLESLRLETQRLIEAGEASHLSDRAVQCDRELHSLIAHGCDQGYLACEIERLGRMVTVARGLLGDLPRRKESALQEHYQLIEALLAENQEAAMDLMKQHIQSACDVLIDQAFRGSNHDSNGQAADSESVTFK